jgi:hypothetical protein
VKILLLLLSLAGAEEKVSIFPRPYQVFQPLFADPRQIQLGAYYYRLNGQNMGDVALGHSWGMARWSTRGWEMQWNVEGMAYSRFQISGDVNKFQAIDFDLNVSLEASNGPLEAKAFVYHTSSHLGDDYIRDTGDQGFRYSLEGARLIVAGSPLRWLRLYGGGSRLIHRTPAQKPDALQLGYEFRSPSFSMEEHPALIYFAHDMQWRQRRHWNMTQRLVLGLRISENEGRRAARLHVGYQEGPSAFGQFFRRKEKQADIGITFEI